MSKVAPEPAGPDEKHKLNPDPELENGPITKRCCTDIICWLIWMTA
jgi:hypothetical protein